MSKIPALSCRDTVECWTESTAFCFQRRCFTTILVTLSRHTDGMNRGRRAFRDVWIIWLVLSVLTTAPYIVCWVKAPADKVFTGVLTAHDDTFTYLAWVKEARDGRLLLCDQFTSEPQHCEFFLPLWVFLGRASRLTGTPIVVVFHG